MLGGIFLSSHACLAARQINIAKNRTAGNTLFMRIASVTYVMMPLLWVAFSQSLHMKALEFAAFVVRVWDLIKPRVLRIECGLHIKMLDSAPFTVQPWKNATCLQGQLAWWYFKKSPSFWQYAVKLCIIQCYPYLSHGILDHIFFAAQQLRAETLSNPWQ